MGNGLLVFLAVIFISTMIGAITNWLKKQQQAELDRRAMATRSGPPRTKPDGELSKVAAEVDRLRQRRAEEDSRPRPMKAVVQSKPSRKPFVVDPPVVAPLVKSTKATKPGLPKVTPLPSYLPPSVEMLPEAPIVTSTIMPSTTESIKRPKDAGEKETKVDAPDLITLLTNPQSLPTAIILLEILGPPKCRKG